MKNILITVFLALTPMVFATPVSAEPFEITPSASAKDPDHAAGKAYLMLNDLPNAEKHLAALRKICLLPCEELDDLDKAVKEYRARQKQPAKR